MRGQAVRLAVVAAVLAWSATAFANGYKILGVKSVKATSMGEAFVVQADDPSAVAFNPAGLAQVRGEQVSVEGTICNAYTERESPLGQETDIINKWQAVPAFYATADFGRNDLAVGLGVSFPNGLSSEWGRDSFARYVDTYSSLSVVDVSPAIGMKFGESLMLGAGVDFYYSKAELDNMVDLGLAASAPGMFDARSELKGKGTAWGGNVGAIYRISPKHSVAVTYRLPFSIKYDGSYTLSALGIDADASTTMDFPAVVVAGYAFRPTDRWTLEFDADWTDWRGTDDVTVEFKTPGLPNVTRKESLRNTMAYKIGAEYRYTDNLALRCGYIYNENATPDEAWRPSLPDTSMHFLMAGFGYRIGPVTINTALQVVFYEKRTIDNNVDANELTSSSSIDGTYRTWAPCASVGATYRF